MNLCTIRSTARAYDDLILILNVPKFCMTRSFNSTIRTSHYLMVRIIPIGREIENHRIVLQDEYFCVDIFEFFALIEA